jgi:hypothetical protein
MGRSFSISLVTKSRIGASVNLSRRLCGSGSGNEVLSGQSCFGLSDNEGVEMPAHGDNGTVISPFTINQKEQIIYAQLSADERRSKLKAASYWEEDSGFVNPGAISSHGGAAFNFDKWKGTLHMRTGLDAASSDIRMDAEMPGFDSRLCFNLNRQHTLQLRAEVESTPSALFFGKRNCGGNKEM